MYVQLLFSEISLYTVAINNRLVGALAFSTLKIRENFTQISTRMPDLSYLDTLSNKELHQKWLERGLPNIPVTDSSRQVILRRLRAIYQQHTSTTSWEPMDVDTDSDNDAENQAL